MFKIRTLKEVCLDKIEKNPFLHKKKMGFKIYGMGCYFLEVFRLTPIVSLFFGDDRLSVRIESEGIGAGAI